MAVFHTENLIKVVDVHLLQSLEEKKLSMERDFNHGIDVLLDAVRVVPSGSIQEALLIDWIAEKVLTCDEEYKRVCQALKEAKEFLMKKPPKEELNIDEAKNYPCETILREANFEVKNRMCKCPFHDDESPSLSVRAVNNRFKCFGCGESGDSIALYIKIHNCTFPDAVRALTK